MSMDRHDDQPKLTLRAAYFCPGIYFALAILALLAIKPFGEGLFVVVLILSIPLGLIGMVFASVIGGESGMMVAAYVPMIFGPIQWFVIGLLIDRFRLKRHRNSSNRI